MRWEGSLAEARGTEGVLVGWRPDGFRRLDTYRGIKQKVSISRVTGASHFHSEEGNRDMRRRKPKMSPLVLEWSGRCHLS